MIRVRRIANGNRELRGLRRHSAHRSCYRYRRRRWCARGRIERNGRLPRSGRCASRRPVLPCILRDSNRLLGKEHRCAANRTCLMRCESPVCAHCRDQASNRNGHDGYRCERFNQRESSLRTLLHMETSARSVFETRRSHVHRPTTVRLKAWKQLRVEDGQQRGRDKRQAEGPR